jgi:hypothetical protein
MKVSIHCLRWTNNNPRVIENHKKVYDHFDLPVTYTEANINHGDWINAVLERVDSDVFVFVDSDCVPLNREAVTDAIEYCAKGYLVGNAQVTNCIKAKHDLFCAPSFLAISKQYYESIGKPSAKNDDKNDIAQAFTRAAVDREKRIKMYFPTSFQGIPVGGIWRLASYGYYGIGTIYDNKMYHLYQTRLAKNVDLFVDTCNKILEGNIESINRQYDSRSEWMGKLPIEDEYGL